MKNSSSKKFLFDLHLCYHHDHLLIDNYKNDDRKKGGETHLQCKFSTLKTKKANKLTIEDVVSCWGARWRYHINGPAKQAIMICYGVKKVLRWRTANEQDGCWCHIRKEALEVSHLKTHAARTRRHTQLVIFLILMFVFLYCLFNYRVHYESVLIEMVLENCRDSSDGGADCI